MKPSTLHGYSTSWALFVDYCAVAEASPLPADPATLLDFFICCPAAPGTLRHRVAAIDHQHLTSGHPPPGRHPTVRAALGRKDADPTAPLQHREEFAAALSGLPSHGWTAGMFGRRDRCLLVVSQIARVPFTHIARLTADDITITDRAATITTPAGTRIIPTTPSPVECGPCAITRWLRVLDLAITKQSPRDLARALRLARPVTVTTPHACSTPVSLSETAKAAPLFTPIDQWGYLPLPPQALSPHSLSRRVSDLMTGQRVR